MTDLSRESRALLKGARKDFDASSDERDRVGRALATRIGVAAGTLAATTTSASASAAGAVTTVASVGTGAAASVFLAGTKWAGVVLLVGAVGAGGVSVYRTERTERKAKTSAHAITSPTPPRVAPSSSPGPVRESVTSAPATTAEAPAGIRPRAGIEPSLEGAPRAHTSSRDNRSVGTVAQETHLLRLADEAMRSGDARRALDLLDEHASVFPNGILAEERSAERVSTLCTLGRVAEAHEEATRFLRATPDSPLAESVRSSCGSPQR